MRTIKALTNIFVISYFSFALISCNDKNDVVAPKSATVLKIEVLNHDAQLVPGAIVKLFKDSASFTDAVAGTPIALKVADANGIATFSTPDVALVDSQYYYMVSDPANEEINNRNAANANLFRLSKKLELNKTTTARTIISPMVALPGAPLPPPAGAGTAPARKL